jgi:hypothetical protein
MAKTFGSKMESGENLGWCKPIILTYKDKKATIAQNEGTVAGLAIDGKISEGTDYLVALTDHFGIGPAQLGENGATSLSDFFNYEFNGASVEVEEELGCRECPFFKECDAMNEEVEDEDDDD